MIKNILFYIICLILSCGLFIKYNEYLFLLIFIFLISTPIIFMCINFYVKRHLEFDISLTSKSNNKDNLCNFSVKVSNKGLLPIRKLAVVLKYKNSKSSSKLNKKIIFTSVTSKSDEFLMCNIIAKHCGIIDITLEKVKIYDPFSITFLSKKIKKKINYVVLPELYKEEQNIKSDSFYEEDEYDDKTQYKNNYINNKSELVDYSEYKQGDSINKINWKLSAKKDKLFVKKYEGRESKVGLIVVENIIKENDSYEKILQKVFSISMNYIDNGINHKIVWYDNNTNEYVCDYIDSSEKTYLAIRHILQCDIACEAYKGIEYLNDKLTSNCSDIYYVTNKTIQSDIIKKYRYVNIIKIDEGKEYEDDSIIFSKDINLEARNYKKLSNIVCMIFELLLCTSFVYALVYEVFSKLLSYNALVKSLNIFAPYIIICVAVIFIIFSITNKKIRRIGISLIVCIYLLALFLFRNLLINGGTIIVCLFMDKFNNYANYVVKSYVDFAQADLPKEVIIVFLLIIFFIAIISCIFISYKPGSMIIIILSAIPITMDILLREKINLCCSFFMIIAIIYSIYKSHKCVIRKKNNNKTFLFKRKKSYLINKEYYKNISVFSSAILLGVTIIILGMSFSIVRPSFIENDKVNEVRQQLNKSIFEDKSIEKIFNYFIYGKVSGGINEGRFGNIEEIEYDNSIHLKVALDKRYFNEDIYLKGYVADVYTGNSFKQSPKDDFELNDVLDKSDIFSSEYKFNENMFIFQKNVDVNDISLDDICVNRGINELTQNEISAFNNIKPEDKSMYIFLEMVRSSIRVQNVAANDKYLYVPYNSYCNNNVNYYKDLCICPNKKLQQNSYSVFLSNPYNAIDTDAIIPERIKNNYVSYKQLKEREKIYRQYVYDKYTKLPDKGLEKIKARYKNIKDREFEFRDYDRYIEQVRSDISCNTEYSLAPGKTPKNKDFVEYFLYENKKGYCCHYAAAATVIFRAMGIPARYVEGYVIRTNDYDFDSKMGEYIISDSSNYMNNYQNRHLAVIANVKDSNAHAWTEIYIDGYGWIPLEVTKTNDYNKTNIDSIIDSKSQDNNKSNTNNSNDNVKDNNSNINEVTNVDDNNDDENNDHENNYNEIVNDYKSDIANQSINKLIIYTFFIIFSVIMALVIRIIFIRIRRKRLFNTDNNKDAVLNMSKYFMSIVSFKNNLYDNISYNEFINLISENYKFTDSLEYEEVIKIMYKAKFSNKNISANEKNKVSKFILNFSNNLYYTLKIYDKIKFRLIKVL